MNIEYLQYLRTMAATLELGGVRPFQPAPLDPPDGQQPMEPARFHDCDPGARFAKLDPPFCILEIVSTRNKTDGRIRAILPSRQDEDGVIARSSRRLYEAVVTCRLDFWLANADVDILSSDASPGLTHQILRYVAANQSVAVGEHPPCRVAAQNPRIVRDPDGILEKCKVCIEIVFSGGIYETIEEPGLAGAELVFITEVDNGTNN